MYRTYYYVSYLLIYVAISVLSHPLPPAFSSPLTHLLWRYTFQLPLFYLFVIYHVCLCLCQKKKKSERKSTWILKNEIALSSSCSIAQKGEVAYGTILYLVEPSSCRRVLISKNRRLISCVMRERRLMVISRSAPPECSLFLRLILRVFLFRNLSTLNT